MTKLEVRRLGNTLAVVIPEDVAQRLKVDGGDHLFLIEAPDGSMRISAENPELDDQMRIAREGMARYRNTLRALAK